MTYVEGFGWTGQLIVNELDVLEMGWRALIHARTVKEATR